MLYDLLLHQNDSIIDMISNTPGPELAPARDLIKRWRHRKLYKCVFVIDTGQQCMDLKQITNEIIAVSDAMVHNGDTITCNLNSSSTATAAATAGAGADASTDTAHRHKRARAQPIAATTATTNGHRDSDTEPDDSDDDIATNTSSVNSTGSSALNGQHTSSSTSRMQSITEGNEDDVTTTPPDKTEVLHAVNGGSSASTSRTGSSGPLTNGVLHSTASSSSGSIHQQQQQSEQLQQQQQQLQQQAEAAVPVARFTAADFVCEICDMHCGQHADNPTANMRFYNKFDRGDGDSPQTPLGIPVEEDWYVGTLPKKLYQRQLRVFVKDVAKADALAHVLEAWHQQVYQKPAEQLDDE
jgi:hypothetical protein